MKKEEIIDVITNRSWKYKQEYPNTFYRTEADFHRENHSEPGPNNLVRHKIDDVHCIGHGEGTWDLITGEFS